MSQIDSRVLSDEFHDFIDGRRLRAAVFLTFRFDPGFFEQEVLPAFLDVPLSHVPEIRLLNLDQELRQVDSVAVYYDRRGLEAGAASGKLDVQRRPLSHPTGYFHPKNVLALVEDADAPVRLSLIVAAMSANLTRAGWWQNVEAAHIEEVEDGAECSFREDLLKLIDQVRVSSSSTYERHDALDAIAEFARRLKPDPQRIRERVLLPRIFPGGDLVAFLRDIAGNRLQRCSLEVLSPYFDSGASAGPLEQLKAAFRPRNIRVFLPRGREYEALCQDKFYEAVKKIADWGTLPKEVMRLSKSIDRMLHAKVYRFFDRDHQYEAMFVGSANLTGPAFNLGGNVESGFFVESPPRRGLDWWLEVDKKTPHAFIEQKEDEGLSKGRGWKLSLRFDWHSGRAFGFWDDRSPSPRLSLLAHGVEIGRVESLAPQQWLDLGQSISQRLQQELKSSSFVAVHIEGDEEDARILVEEEQMTHKPSLMSTLSADDILRYWSLLTAEQKQEFIEDHAQELVTDPELALWLADRRGAESSDTFFTTVTEVYLSFGNLERAVRNALKEKRPREAVDRLFGQKFDSLRRLIERVLEEDSADAVRRYVTLLCARQLLDVLEGDEREFMAEHRGDVKALRSSLDRVAAVRERLKIGKSSERDQFCQWFERWFVSRAQMPEAVAE